MALSEYKKKRTFSDTPEPEGGKPGKANLQFVIQKHDASHLHYDFRLEMEGVLKSWAVPKGPSTDPEVKRLAMMVEDHPFDYKNFEGIIPEGNYGAGSVIVWDEGTYEPVEGDAKTKKDKEKELLKQLKAGKLKFVLKGKKVKGEYALIKSYGKQENAWLLMKLKDKYAATSDITKKNKSVKSSQTVEQVAKESDNVWQSNRKSSTKTSAKKSASATVKKKALKKANDLPDNELKQLLADAPDAVFPKPFKPMLATLVSKPFDSENWIYEIKWDGYRAVAYVQNGKAEITSRNLNSYNDIFQPVVAALEEWNVDSVLDGEIVAVNDKGLPDFQKLQNVRNNGEAARLVYHIFDLLWYDGKNIMELPLLQRKTILQKILPTDSDVFKYSDHIKERGTAFFNLAVEQQLEGVIAKDGDSTYSKGSRSKSWLKIKNNLQLEAIICGYTEPRNSRKMFGALILGRYFNGELKYIGHTGTGFTDKTLKEVHKKMQPLITDKSPLTGKTKVNMPATWLKPELVCEVKYSEKTKDNLLRHPVFMGLREDKHAANEKGEIVVAPPDETEKNKASSSKKTTKKQPASPKKKATATKKKLMKVKN